MSNPFDYVNSVSHTKKDIMRGTDNDELAEKGYSPWLTNLAFSNHIDTILHANEINMRSHMTNLAQYQYYFYALPKRKRYGWNKVVVDDDLELICQAYQCNKKVGKQYQKLLSEDQLKELRESMETGGTS